MSTSTKLQDTVFSVIVIISLSHFLNDMLQSVVPSIYPLIKDPLGLSFTQIGMITLVYQCTSSILQPLTEYFADKKPRPYSLSVGMLFSFTGVLMLAFTQQYELILLAVSFIGLGSSIFHPTASRVVQTASGGRKSLAQSIFQVGGSSGTALGPLLAALVVLPFGQSAISVFSMAAVIASILLLKVGSWYAASLKAALSYKSSRHATACTLSKRAKTAVLALLVFLVFSKHFYTACITNYYTFFLMEKFSQSVRFSQICLFVFLGCTALGTLIGGFLGDRIGRKYVIWLSIFGAAPFAAALPHLNLAGTVICTSISGFIIASAFASILVYATDILPNHVGMIAGFFYGLMFGLGGLGSAFFGWMADKTGIIFVFYVSSLLPLLGIFAGFLPDPQRKNGKI